MEETQIQSKSAGYRYLILLFIIIGVIVIAYILTFSKRSPLYYSPTPSPIKTATPNINVSL